MDAQQMPAGPLNRPVAPQTVPHPTKGASEAGERAKRTRARADAWFQREVEAAAKVHGARWPEHEAWVRAYLVEEARQRLLAAGWSPQA